MILFPPQSNPGTQSLGRGKVFIAIKRDGVWERARRETEARFGVSGKRAIVCEADSLETKDTHLPELLPQSNNGADVCQ